MNTVTLPASTLRIIAAAPHRLMFFIGATNTLLAMVWWAWWLISARWLGGTSAQPMVPPGWLHAIVMQYQVLPAFMFGFLLTVFPRWMALPPLRREHYVPVGIGMFGGQLITLAALAGFGDSNLLLKVGAVLTTGGWLIGTLWLVRLVSQEGGRTWHAVSCAFALGFGLLGLTLYSVFLFVPDPRVAFAAIKLGTFAVLLPIYFTVCHRMIPFFAGSALRNYQPTRPMWTLALFWPLTLIHSWLELRHGYAWLWLVDVPMAAMTGWLLWRWWPRRTQMPALLRVLFVGFAWLPVAFVLYAVQSVQFAATSQFILGRAPAHALFIGFFGSLLVAMVTRVTQGHSGRPLVLGNVAAFAFICIQLVTLTRIVAELVPDSLAIQAIAALGWLVAFVPWVLRSSWIYLTPRVDGAQG
ncbi:protein NnrS [Steroidobacter agaridevorans]|uniref:Protein NnrS n=1 Tax=Steroidobacter agaridevorans TaxID=2695856 RepID=A0A829Y7V6_9GAMM|nr:NnrS family protein [Steroidobacter agaridevorans]GFE79280.1 protein NnrS [Steroidobacter agaridevorans]